MENKVPYFDLSLSFSHPIAAFYIETETNLNASYCVPGAEEIIINRDAEQLAFNCLASKIYTHKNRYKKGRN